MGSALRRVPAWAWLTAIVAGSVLVRTILVRGIVAPFIFVDEVIWSELARGIADAGKPLLRDQPDPGYSVVYPLLISPAYALFELLDSPLKICNYLIALLEFFHELIDRCAFRYLLHPDIEWIDKKKTDTY